MPQEAATGFRSLGGPLGWILSAAAIVAVTLLAYLPVMSGGFIWDDHTSIVHNVLIQAPDGLRLFWFSRNPPDYFPLTSTTHWIEWRLWSDHPAGYHIVNILLHAAGAVLLWRVLLRLRVPSAWLAGVLFGVHPVAVASAGWIVELKNVLSMVFYLSSLLAFLRFDELANAKVEELEGRRFGPSFVPLCGTTAGRDSEIGKSGKREEEESTGAADHRRPNLPLSHSPSFPLSRFAIYLLSVILFFLALLSKTSIIMLPVVLLLCAWWRRRSISQKDLLHSLPFLALSLALGLVTVWFQAHNAISGFTVRPEEAASRIAAAGWITWFYLYKVLIPAGLTVIYPRWSVPGSRLLAFLPLVLVVAGMTLLWTRRKSWGRAPFFAASYFLITLLPVMGFLDMSFMRLSLVTDHFLYAAMIGVIALAAGALARAAGGTVLKRQLGFLAAAGCVAVLLILSWRRASLYSDEKVLWQDNVAKTPTVWSAWANLGEALCRKGFHDEGMRCLDKAIALRPNLAELYYQENRGAEWVRAQNYVENIGDYDNGIPLNVDFPKGDFAATCYNRGWAYAKAHRFAKAVEEYDKAISLDNGFAAAYNNRAIVYARMGRLDDALRDYTKAIEANPDFLIAYFNRGHAFVRAGRPSEAVRDYNKALTLKPDFPVAYYRRAIAYFDEKEYGEALADVKRFQAHGGRPDPEFLKVLEQAAARPE